MQDFTGVRAIATQPPTIGDRRSGQPLSYVLQAPNFEALVKVLPEFLAEASQSPILRQIDVDLKVNRPEGVISINRKKAAELGISVEEIGKTVEFAYSGRRFGYFLKDGKQYQIIAQMQPPGPQRPGRFEKTLRENRGRDDGFVGQSGELRRVRQPGGDLPLQPRGFRDDPGDARAGPHAGRRHRGTRPRRRRRSCRRISAPRWPGQSRDFAESSSSLLFAFLLALVIIYLVLAAQFESFRDPFIIILTVPLSVAGALLSLHVTGQTLNVFSQIGIIMLIGIVTKNGILIVEFANQRKEAGLAKIEAVLDASVARFRPILMTSLATIFGILPIALSLGAAGGSRQSLGIAVVGGLIFSGLLTLFVVPAVYAIFSRGTVKHL